MIEIVTGLPGSGKTLYSAERILKARSEGRRVLANFHSKNKRWEFGLWDDFKRAENALCVIDEAQMWLGSRSFKTTGIEDMAVFQQSRKNGLDLLCIVQHEARLDIAVRELTSYLHRCKNVFGKFTLVKTYAMEDVGSSGGKNGKDKVFSRYVFKHRPQLYKAYFTTEVIGLRDGKGYELGAASGGGRVELVDGRFSPTHVRFESEFGIDLLPYGEPSDAHWERLAALYNQARSGGFFSWRPVALLEGKMYFTDEEQTYSPYTVVDRMMDSTWFQTVERIERKLGVIK